MISLNTDETKDGTKVWQNNIYLKNALKKKKKKKATLYISTIYTVYVIGTACRGGTHCWDHRVWTFLLLVAGTQFMKHTGAWPSTPYAIVLKIRVLTQTAVLPAQGTVIQRYYRKRKKIHNTDNLTHYRTTALTRIRPIIHKYIYIYTHTHHLVCCQSSSLCTCL